MIRLSSARQQLGILLALLLLLTAASAVYAQCPIAAACTPGAASDPNAQFFQMGIYQVQIGTINHSSAGYTEGYQDYSCTQGATLTVGSTYSISIRTGTLAAENVRVWIDYNNNGILNATSELFFSSNNAQLHNGNTLSIPATAVLNTPLRLRVAADAATAPLPTPCSTPQFSQVEDYAVTIQTNTQPPLAAFAAAAGGTGCTGVFQFTDQSQRAPATWQWRFGDGGTSPLPNPTHTYAQPGTYPVRLTVCNAFGCDSLLDSVRWYAPLPVAAPCTPATTAYCCGYGITAVSLAGQTQASANGSAGYEDFSCRRQFTLIRGQQATLAITTGGTVAHSLAAWIDYNNDGQFAAAEQILVNATAASPGTTITFRPPSGALLNTPLRLRVSADAAGQPLTPCSAPRVGQVEDYRLVIRRPPACALSALPPLVVRYDPCGGARARLTLPLADSSIVCQWETSTDSLSWADVPGATGFSFFSPAVTGKIYYRLRATCGPQTLYSQAWPFGLVPCYCRGLHSGTTANGDPQPFYRVFITNEALQMRFKPDFPLTGDSLHQTFYTYPPNQTARLRRGATYEIGFSVYHPDLNILMWLDTNRNGIFSTQEGITLVRNIGVNDSSTHRKRFTIPRNAFLGTTVLRLRTGIPGLPVGGLACADRFTFGATQDYVVTIVADDCSANLQPGTIQGDPYACPGRTPNLWLAGATPGALVTWQFSPDGLTWDTLAHVNADTSLLRAMPTVTAIGANRYVRARLSCGTATVTSAPVHILDDFLRCYCSAAPVACGEPALRTVRLGNTTLHDRRTLCPSASYRLADTTQAATTATVLRGVAYPLTITPARRGPGGSLSAAFDAVAWVDYDHNGTFDYREQTVLRVLPGSPDSVATLVIPPSAALGVTRLRLIVRQARNGHFLAVDQCAYDSTQEIRDYQIRIAAPATSQWLTAGGISGRSAICRSTPFRLQAVHFSFDATLQWQQLIGGTWTDLLGQRGATLLVAGITAPTSFRVAATRGPNTVYSTDFAVSPTGPCVCTQGLDYPSPFYADRLALAGPGAELFIPSWLRPIDTYLDYSAKADSLPITVYRGQQYWYGWNDRQGGVWLDSNQNEQLEPSEFTAVGTASFAPNRLSTLTIPATASLGPTRIRFRRSFASRNYTATEACSTTNLRDHSTLDLMLEVVDAPAFVAPELAGPDTVCLGGTIRLRPTIALPAGCTYLWESPTGWLGNTAEVVHYHATPADAGYYYLTVTAPNGYQLTAARYVAVDASCTVLGLTADRATYQVELFPNPTPGQTTLRVQGAAQPLTVRVLSSTGQLLETRALPATPTQELPLDMSRYPKGLYLVQVQGAASSVYRPLVIE